MRRDVMALLRAWGLCGMLLLVLSQCRCIRGCISFFKGHASQGGVPPVTHTGSPLARPVTLEQFVEANAGRGLSYDVLRRRFEVADADADGVLTPEEVQRHREIAIRNKRERS